MLCKATAQLNSNYCRGPIRRLPLSPNCCCRSIWYKQDRNKQTERRDVRTTSRWSFVIEKSFLFCWIGWFWGWYSIPLFANYPPNDGGAISNSYLRAILIEVHEKRVRAIRIGRGNCVVHLSVLGAFCRGAFPGDGLALRELGCGELEGGEVPGWLGRSKKSRTKGDLGVAQTLRAQQTT